MRNRSDGFVVVLGGASASAQLAHHRCRYPNDRGDDSRPNANVPRGARCTEPHKGAVQHYEGVRISDLLAKAGVSLGEKLRGRSLATYVVAQASDDYAVVYSIADLDPAMTDNRIILDDTKDGKPLAVKEGPFKIVVPGDKRPAHWIRMVNVLRVENALNPSGSSPR